MTSLANQARSNHLPPGCWRIRTANIVSRVNVKKKKGRLRNCVLFLGIISASLSSFQKVQLRMHPRVTSLPNKFSPMAGALVHLVVQPMEDGALGHMRLQAVVEDIGEVILTHPLQVVGAAVRAEVAILQGGTVILTVPESMKGVLSEGTHPRIAVGGVIGVGDGRRRIHDLEAHRGGELRGMIKISVFLLQVAMRRIS